jgi:hypothetical protein
MQSLLCSGISFSFEFIVWEDVALIVFVLGLHEFVVGGINGLSVFVYLVIVSITAVDYYGHCVSFVIRDVFRVPNIRLTRCDAFVRSYVDYCHCCICFRCLWCYVWCVFGFILVISFFSLLFVG